MLSILLAIMAAMTFAWGQHTTQKRLRPVAIPDTAMVSTSRVDTLAGDTAFTAARFSGYEKRLRATRETMFVTNTAACDIVVTAFTIDYLDQQGRLLHRRTPATSLSIPQGETRRLDLPSWDTQHSFYCSPGQRPRVPAIPYTVKISNPVILLTH